MQPQIQNIDYATKRRLIIGGLLFLLLIVLGLVSGYSTISIQMVSASSGQISYQLSTDQAIDKGSDPKILTTNKTKVTRFVKSGDYQLRVTQGNKTAFAIIKTRGFFWNSSVKAVLTTKPSRQFVGSGPEACSYYLGGVLSSYNCAGSTSKTVHVPATATTPTYNQTTIDGVFGAYEGITNTTQGKIALFNTNSGHQVYVLTGKSRQSDGITLSDLDTSETYSLASYKDGFITYNRSFSDIKYYASTNSRPEKVNIPEAPSNSNQKPLAISASNDVIVASYSDKADYDALSQPKDIGKVNGRIYYYTNNQIIGYAYDQPFSAAVPCGADQLCVLNGVNKTLLVYQAKAKLKLLYTMTGVNSIQPYGKDLLIATYAEIIDLNTDNRSGFVVQSLTDYQFCGFQDLSTANYLMCLADIHGHISMLLVTPSLPDTEDIDGRVAKLVKLSEVASVSAYGKYVFISANAGDLVYNVSLNKYAYNQSEQKAAVDKINQTIKDFGTGSTIFKITNAKQ